MPMTIALAGAVVSELFTAVYATLAPHGYDAPTRLQVALELTRITLPLLTIKENANELQPNGRQFPLGGDPGRSDSADA
jgi:hypothetical protein